MKNCARLIRHPAGMLLSWPSCSPWLLSKSLSVNSCFLLYCKNLRDSCLLSSLLFSVAPHPPKGHMLVSIDYISGSIYIMKSSHIETKNCSVKLHSHQTCVAYSSTRDARFHVFLLSTIVNSPSWKKLILIYPMTLRLSVVILPRHMPQLSIAFPWSCTNQLPCFKKDACPWLVKVQQFELSAYAQYGLKNVHSKI